MLDLLARAVLRGAGHHRGEIGHEEAAGAEQLRQTEDREAAGEHQHRCQRGFEPQMPQRPQLCRPRRSRNLGAVANAAGTTAEVWWVQGFVPEEDVAFTGKPC